MGRAPRDLRSQITSWPAPAPSWPISRSPGTDRIALLHLGVKHISWPFISLCSFTTYALSHNIGASVFSGAMVRYRAYSTKGLTASQVAVLVVLCSYTFGFGNVLLGGLLLTYDPDLMQRLSGFLPDIFTHPHGRAPWASPASAGWRSISSAR